MLRYLLRLWHKLHWRRLTDTRAFSHIFRQWQSHRECCCHRRNPVAFQATFRTSLRRPLGSSSKIDEVPSSKSNRRRHAYLRGDEHSTSSDRGLSEFSTLAGLSDDPDDLSALSLGLLIGAPLLAIPEPSLTEKATSSLSLVGSIFKKCVITFGKGGHANTCIP